jgi:hypothetical protein
LVERNDTKETQRDDDGELKRERWSIALQVASRPEE